MPRSKKHYFIVEITDTSGEHSGAQVTHLMQRALNRSMAFHDGLRFCFENGRVKSLSRVMAAFNSPGHHPRWLLNYVLPQRDGLFISRGPKVYRVEADDMTGKGKQTGGE